MSSKYILRTSNKLGQSTASELDSGTVYLSLRHGGYSRISKVQKAKGRAETSCALPEGLGLVGSVGENGHSEVPNDEALLFGAFVLLASMSPHVHWGRKSWLISNIRLYKQLFSVPPEVARKEILVLSGLRRRKYPMWPYIVREFVGGKERTDPTKQRHSRSV